MLVNSPNALDFGKLAEHGQKNGLHQALNIPADTGRPVQYAGSPPVPELQRGRFALPGKLERAPQGREGEHRQRWRVVQRETPSMKTMPMG